jgi:DNA polymerase-3 subunit gamma/tau
MTDETHGAYQVLARKYRPQDFSALIGQEAMVRVLRNAFEKDRIHHAYVLTGVRGIGKTTTARIIAKGLNCIGADGTGGPTVEPCGVCEHCKAIIDSRHVDVIEMDAASNTGIDDVREVIEAAKYRPAMARYKVFIIDETHMLSKQAFNGLLKTLEEPPEHVKFLFATTEIRKMPVTVLSRCQRFDLRRIEPERLIEHLASICQAEGVEIETEALALVARAAEGSVRDALSLLDQAIADGGQDAASVRTMLGLADRARVLDLFGMIMRGEAKAALEELRDQHRSGADPEATLRDLAETTHWLSTLKISPELVNDPALGADTAARGAEMAATLGMRVLARTWQMLLKALDELGRAPSAIMAAEMTIIRLCAVSDLPTPEELVRKLTEEGASGAGGAPAPKPDAGSAPPQARLSVAASNTAPAAAPQARAQAAPAPTQDLSHLPQSFDAVVALISAKKDGELLYDVETGVRLISYAPGRIEFQPAAGARDDLAGRLLQALTQWTDHRWIVSVGDTPGGATVSEARSEQLQSLEQRVRKNPLVAAGLELFKDAELLVIPRKRLTGEEAGEPQDGHEFDDDEDLFGED